MHLVVIQIRMNIYDFVKTLSLGLLMFFFFMLYVCTCCLS